MSGPIVNIAAVPLRRLDHGARFSAELGRIGPLIGAKQLGCQLHVVPAGKTAFPYHAHHANEEMLIILDGEGTLRFGENRYPLRAGDVIGCPAGDAGVAHQIFNSSPAPLKYLAVSTRHDPDVVEYPDSRKFAVTSTVPEGKGLRDARLAFFGRMETTLDYWDGEDAEGVRQEDR